MATTISILGDGQMGLVLAGALAERGLDVRLWGPFPEEAAELARTRLSDRLPGFVLHAEVAVTSDDMTVADGADLIINAIPAQYTRRVWQRLRPYVESLTPVVSVTKGIENETLLRPTQVIAEATGDDPKHPRRPMCVFSGPTIAAELAKQLPATMVAASSDDALAQFVQETFNIDWLRVYRNNDPVGVELAGATKNVIALAAGMVDGIGAGSNAKSALLSRGLVEIARLGTAMGANIDTFFGIAGVGDLATTCFSPHGRNRTCGERLGRGESLDAILQESSSVVEGVPTTRSVVELARQHEVDMPITEAVHRILFEGLSPAEAIKWLMSRDLKAEHIG